MQEAYVNICGVPTHIFTWGRWIEESLDDVKEITICITGNPGLAGYYTPFLGGVHKQLEGKMPVWAIGHLGHDDPPENSIRQVPELKGNEKLFNLDGQIKHKLEFIRQYVPEHVKIHLIGHSIGAWMVLQLLEEPDIQPRIKRCYMLFPTVERMMESPNGWLFTKIGLPFYHIFGFLIALFNRLPQLLQILLVQAYFWFSAIPSHFIGTTLKYLKAAVMEKIVFLAEDEMARVGPLPRSIIEQNKHLLKFYYGKTDGWVPVKYFEEFRLALPAVDAELDQKNIRHAFVLRDSDAMALLAAEWIRQNSSYFQHGGSN